MPDTGYAYPPPPDTTGRHVWPDIEGRWHVQAFNGASMAAGYRNLLSGQTALENARRMYKDFERVYVLTPNGDVYLTRRNGFTRVGF